MDPGRIELPPQRPNVACCRYTKDPYVHIMKVFYMNISKMIFYTVPYI